MTLPCRIQRKQTKGWRMPPNTVYVGCPSRWGNPFHVGQRAMMGVNISFDVSLAPALRNSAAGRKIIEDNMKLSDAVAVPNAMGGYSFFTRGAPGIPCIHFDEPLTIDCVLKLYKGHILERFTARRIKGDLGGKNLACWCALDQPCHADVLLEIANQ